MAKFYLVSIFFMGCLPFCSFAEEDSGASAGPLEFEQELTLKPELIAPASEPAVAKPKSVGEDKEAVAPQARKGEAPRRAAEKEAASRSVDKSQKSAKGKNQAAVSEEDRDLLNRVNRRYQQSKTLQMEIRKRVMQTVLNRETTQEGQLWSVPKKLRIEFTRPNYAAVVVDGQFVWMETHAPKDLGGGIQVAKTKVDYSKKSQGWMALLGRREIVEHFTIQRAFRREQKVVFELQPRGEFQDLTRAELEILPSEEQISQIKFWDDLENETTLLFSKIEVGAKLKEGLFRYTPPKGVSVTTY